MEEFATSSVETGKCQCLEDGVEPHEHLHSDYMGSSDRGRCDLSNQRDDGPAEHSGVFGLCTTNPSGVLRSKKRARHSDDEAESDARRQEKPTRLCYIVREGAGKQEQTVRYARRAYNSEHVDRSTSPRQVCLTKIAAVLNGCDEFVLMLDSGEMHDEIQVFDLRYVAGPSWRWSVRHTSARGSQVVDLGHVLVAGPKICLAGPLSACMQRRSLVSS
jgi:hypothetical protein